VSKEYNIYLIFIVNYLLFYIICDILNVEIINNTIHRFNIRYSIKEVDYESK